MCQSCDMRNERLRQLSAQFATIAAATSQPALRERLIRTAADLRVIAERGCDICAAADIVWAEDDPEAIERDLFSAEA